MADIDDVFEKSNFKGYEGDIPDPRPGTVRLFYSLDFVYFRVTANIYSFGNYCTEKN
jgi:hypothetical protein